MVSSSQLYKVLITTSGIGSRLKELTKKHNKALITINGKPVISYIIESYSKDIELIITIGYKATELKKYILSQYSDRKIKFVKIDLYDGPGSSLGYSMLQAKKYLQCPFIFHCNDTLVFSPIPSPIKYNWNGGSKGTDQKLYNTFHYSSFLSKGNHMSAIYPKGALTYDYFHIGLVGIKDYQDFWRYLYEAYKANPNDTTLNDVSSINTMIKNGAVFHIKDFTPWYDTGNPQGLAFAINSIENTLLPELS